MEVKKQAVTTLPATVGVGETEKLGSIERNVGRLVRLNAEREKLLRRLDSDPNERAEARQTKLASIEDEIARRTAAIRGLREKLDQLGI